MIMEKNLIPSTPGTAPNYWCTWSLQNVAWAKGVEGIEPKEFEGSTGSAHARATINEAYLLGDEGWAKIFYPRNRGDLFLVLDDGWDAPPAGEMITHLGSMVLDPEKYPGLRGETVTDRLRELNEAVKAEGWRGLGLWLPAQESAAYMEAHEDMEPEEYWGERADWCREAGIEYWKVDWGIFAGNHEYRRLISRVAAEHHPGLIIEHSVGCGMFNLGDLGRVDMGWAARVVDQCTFSNVNRLYDICPQLAIPTMLDRLQGALRYAITVGEDTTCILNVEDEAYIGAVTGCAFGVMRYPKGDYPESFTGIIHHSGTRLDEVARALNWQRIAPPFPAGMMDVHVSDEILSDEHTFEAGETWDSSVFGKKVIQSAPAVIARNIIPPAVIDVDPNTDKPFLLATKFPNGAIAVGTFGRVNDDGYRLPVVPVHLEIPGLGTVIGIFGRYKSLKLHNKHGVAAKHIWAQDLAGSETIDICDRVDFDEEGMTISGEVIDEFGLAAATSGDESDPGLVISIGEGEEE
jgi:hypothetical protein